VEGSSFRPVLTYVYVAVYLDIHTCFHLCFDVFCLQILVTLHYSTCKSYRFETAMLGHNVLHATFGTLFSRFDSLTCQL